ncbi:NADH-quinone oxidoreductase subunit M [Paraconexibacter sp.]|uniref:NADH-quinone oxidoreductase subunit M n=1 Tax=Paraconexibacter sp. TaxID=2949640 RepID=UPI0035647D4D
MTLHLSIFLWLPAALGVLGLFLPGKAARLLAALGALGALGYAITAVVDYDRDQGGLQYVTDRTWISELGIHYKLGLDGLNLFLVLLTTVLFLAAVLWSMRKPIEREQHYWLHMGIGQSAVLGALMAQDLALFVAFFDLMLIPFFFLTAGWSTAENRIPAVMKLVIYTLVGSLLMLVAAIATAVLSKDAAGGELTFVLSDLAQTQLGEGTQNWIFLCFAAAFLVKMPAFPVHGWMPDGYRAMPLPVLAVFSGVLSKVAAYGFLRIVTPLFPDAAVNFQTLMLLIALASILYGSALAFTTTDTRLILGYSSLAQLGFILLGVFALNPQGAQGAILQSVNHGLVVAPAFFLVALASERAGGSEDIRDMGGLAFRAPVMATVFLIVALANLAMPGSANFVGEFFILLGVFKAKLVIACIAFAGVALASVYSLRLFIRVMHNRTGADTDSREMTVRDGLVLVPLILAIVALAFYPQLALQKGEKDVTGAVATAFERSDADEFAKQSASGEGAEDPTQAANAPRPQSGGSGQIVIDPNTGQPVDPNTGQPIDPSTGQPVSPAQEPTP